MLVVLVVTVGIGIVRGQSAPVEDVVVSTPEPQIVGGDLYVHVSGAVREPGLYVLRAEARIVDAVAAAGGFAEGADEGAVNLARAVSDGEQVVVPVLGAAVVPGLSAEAAPGGGRIDLNTATEADLDTLPRIGPAMASRIVEWREDNGRFTSVEDLLAVPGIGEKMLEALRELVTV